MNNPGPRNVLAVFGRQPAFADLVHVGRPNIGDRSRLMERFNRMLDARWFSNHGPLVREFEARIAEYVGVSHVVSVCNATIGLEIAIRAAGLSGEVIVPSYTFVATAHALQWQEITPVFADMDPSTHNIDPAAIERLVTPRTTGILATHVWGRPCDIDALAVVAAKHKLKLLFDAAHAFGCSYKGRMIGSNGVAEVFSFHATKVLNSFEGGAICTNDAALAAKMRLMTNFGFAGYDTVEHVGTNGKMTEVCAAMGLTSLEAIGDLVDANRRNYAAYTEGLAGIPGLQLIKYPPEGSNFHYIVVEIDEAEFGLTRDHLVAALHAENVLARRYFWPGCHRMQPYRALFPNAHLLLPNTERVAARVVVLPTGESLDAASIARICQLVRDCHRHASAVAEALNAQSGAAGGHA